MKTLLTSSFFLLASSFACLAVPSWLAINSEEYENDESPSADTTFYSAYYCTVDQAGKMFGGKTSVGDITSYLSKNFASGKTALAANDATLRTSNPYAQTIGYDYFGQQYAFVDNFSSALTVGNYLAILLYENGDDAAVRVLGNASWTGTTGVTFDDASTTAASGSIGEWTAATVPEPTSGLLLLLGFAGLALRRRR